MQIAGIKIISPGKNGLNLVHYSVVIPLHPLRRGTLTLVVSLWLCAWYLSLQVLRKYIYKAISPIQASSKKSPFEGGWGDDSTGCIKVYA